MNNVKNDNMKNDQEAAEIELQAQRAIEEVEQHKIRLFIHDCQEEIESFNKELRELAPLADYNEAAIRRRRMLLAARAATRKQIQELQQQLIQHEETAEA